MAVTLQGEKVIDSWGIVIEQGAGRDEYLLELIERNLEHAELPEITWQMVAAAPGILKGLFGKKRNYLMVSHTRLKDFHMYVGARDFGRHLDVSWFLSVEPSSLKRGLSELLTEGKDPAALSFHLDIFDQQDLRGYVTVVHKFCVRSAVEQLLEEIGENPMNFDWRTRGFLRIW